MSKTVKRDEKRGKLREKLNAKRRKSKGPASAGEVNNGEKGEGR